MVCTWRASVLDFGAVELANEALFDHERRVGAVAAVVLRAAAVGETTAARTIEASEQALAAAWTVQRVAPGLALVGMVLVQQAKKFEDAGRCQLGALELVEPDALAGKADVEGDLAVELALGS
jgi:hypothetical protein